MPPEPKFKLRNGKSFEEKSSNCKCERAVVKNVEILIKMQFINVELWCFFAISFSLLYLTIHILSLRRLIVNASIKFKKQDSSSSAIHKT